MLKAKDYAQFFTFLLQDLPNSDLSEQKLNQLLYFAQGHMLQQTGRPLFFEPIEVRESGPAVADIHYERELTEFDPEVFSEKEQRLLLDVARKYGGYPESRLREIVQGSDTSWSACYRIGKTIIPNRLVKAYFDRQPPLKPFEIDYSKMEEIGYRDADGYLVLPTEENW